MHEDYDEGDVRDPDWDDVPAEAVQTDGTVVTVNGENGLFVVHPGAYGAARRLREDREADR